MLVLDTQLLPATERAEAFQATVSANCSSSMASFEEPASIHAKPRASIHAAARNLRSSPLHELVRDHVARVTAQADQLADSAAASRFRAAFS